MMVKHGEGDGDGDSNGDSNNRGKNNRNSTLRFELTATDAAGTQ